MAELSGVGGRRRRSRVGFTVIEVMVSLVVIMVSATAMAALITRGVRANAHARNLALAMEIADRWATRFKQDARNWTQVGFPAGTPGQPTTAAVLAGTTWLRNIEDEPGTFRAIDIVAGSLFSNGFDFYGRDKLWDGDDEEEGAFEPLVFCAAYRQSWVYLGRTMRIDIRVWWRRERTEFATETPPMQTTFGQCTESLDSLDPGNADVVNYHVVYLPVTISAVTN